MILSPVITSTHQHNEEGFHKKCPNCGEAVVKYTKHGKYCDDACKVAYGRKRGGGKKYRHKKKPQQPQPGIQPSILERVYKQLEIFSS